LFKNILLTNEALFLLASIPENVFHNFKFKLEWFEKLINIASFPKETHHVSLFCGSLIAYTYESSHNPQLLKVLIDNVILENFPK
jgi:hypothetical protein